MYSSKNILLLGLMCSILFSCGKLKEQMKNMEDMKTTTSDMSSTTDEMNQTTSEMNQTTQRMEELTRFLLLMNRVGAASELRDTSWYNLKNVATTIEDKITDAVKFLMAFEYQFWTNNSLDADSILYRDELFLDAADEFLRRLLSLTNNIDLNKTSIFDLKSDDLPDGNSYSLSEDDILEKENTKEKENTLLSLLALSVSLHKTQAFQNIIEEDSHKRGQSFKKFSMLDMIKDSLRNRTKNENELPEYQISLLRKQQELIKLLNLRIEMLLILTLGEGTDLKKVANTTSGFKKWLGRIFRKGASLKSNFKNLPAVNKTLIMEDYLNEALKTRHFLISEVGTKVHIEDRLNKTIKNIKFDRATDEEPNEFEKALRVFVNADELTEAQEKPKVTKKGRRRR